eukprot:Plantae.Rhodophyta-Purpureofilum_apyrenoidigerum.ctg10408.p1 GENE.Plantae.Rhodophyta-Purpureofilum_apyrenoidigerum.ctg10408~~Plantae.Rhodophyta-Purpureofilum_apyrenoidigerum.ctg10408.p1  ORF type:complete len:698 (+),score=125.79 Plantae.Rhodophyta-Purpureofilum_apyrenoidigerum.ctg10408:140-2233(+)
MQVQGGIDAFIDGRLEALRVERDEELREIADIGGSDVSFARLEAAGVAVCRLHLDRSTSGYGSRDVYVFQGAPGRIIEAGKMSSGDLVVVRASKESSAPTWSGVLGAVRDIEIEVIIDEVDADQPFDVEDSKSVVILRAGSDVTYNRLVKVLEDLRKMRSDHPAWLLRRTLFEGRLPKFSPVQNSTENELFFQNLNDIQLDAVKHAMGSDSFSCIHGPPGTGKTTTIVALICAEVQMGARVLVSAPSNVAVDNVLERLASMRPKTRLLRLGHPARLMESVLVHSLDYKLARTDEAALSRDIRNEIDGLEKQCNGKIGKAERRRLRTEQRDLRKELRRRENEALRRLILSHDVVLTTTTGAGVRQLDLTGQEGIFDLVVIDEAAQSLEEGCWIAMMRARRCVLAGDPYQLPATIKSNKARKLGLEKTLMDRVFENKMMESACVRMLQIQFRMHEVISDWSSQATYQGRLVPHESVAKRTLAELENVQSTEDTTVPVLLIDTNGCNYDESVADDDSIVADSKSNFGEGQLLSIHVRRLISAGVKPTDISVISPYAAQISLLRSLLAEERELGMEVATVDSFQGRENEAVVLSLVRSNATGELGFVTDRRRINVAVTRAKRHVCIICNAEFVSKDPFLVNLVRYCEDRGDVRYALTYEGLGDLHISNLEPKPQKLKETKKSKPTRTASKPAKKKSTTNNK